MSDPWGENPTLKFRIGHEHKVLLATDYCYGDLYVSASRIRYHVVGPYSVHSFDLARSEVTGTKPWYFGLEMVTKPRKYHVVLYPLDKGTPQVAILVAVIDPNYINPQPLADALTNFPMALERARANLPRPAPPPPPPEPPKPPEVLILEPAGENVEVNTATIDVRGVAMDSKGIALVRVGNKLATMQPRTLLATEFWVEDLPLAIGENQIEVVVTNTERVEAKSVVKVGRVEAPPPEPPKPTGLSVDEVTKLLAAGVTPARVETIVKERGVGFELNDENEKKLRDAGATDALLLVIAKTRK
ncbi:MAG TPA: hypothetical protein VNN18_11220 [Candidatus Xenobia bacterium]|nr:hypothetical protein [Candidatus Xenobia bacterium]